MLKWLGIIFMSRESKILIGCGSCVGCVVRVGAELEIMAGLLRKCRGRASRESNDGHELFVLLRNHCNAL